MDLQEIVSKGVKWEINVCQKSYFESKTLYWECTLTLQTTFMFTGVLAKDEFIKVFDILIHIIACFIVTVLLV